METIRLRSNDTGINLLAKVRSITIFKREHFIEFPTVQHTFFAFSKTKNRLLTHGVPDFVGDFFEEYLLSIVKATYPKDQNNVKWKSDKNNYEEKAKRYIEERQY